jgi:hypothetical protein
LLHAFHLCECAVRSVLSSPACFTLDQLQISSRAAQKCAL